MSYDSRMLIAICATCIGLIVPVKASALTATSSAIAQVTASGVADDGKFVRSRSLDRNDMLDARSGMAIATAPSPEMAASPAASPPPAQPPALGGQKWVWILGGLLLLTTTVGIGLALFNHRRIAADKGIREKEKPEQPPSIPRRPAVKNVTLSKNGTLFSHEDNIVPSEQLNSQPSAAENSSEMIHVNRSNSSLQTPAVNETTRLTRVDIVEELMKDLHNPDAVKRRKSIWELGQVGDSRAVQPLVDLMMDSDSSQRSLILASISEIGIRALKPINRALLLSLQDQSSDVRKNAIRDVTRVYDMMTQISQLLTHASTDPEKEVRETAQWALSQFNRMRAVPGAPDLTNLPSSATPDQLPGRLDS